MEMKSEYSMEVEVEATEFRGDGCGSANAHYQMYFEWPSLNPY